MAQASTISPNDHLEYMRLALSEAKKSPPKLTNFCVGAVLLDADTNTILATGYTLELPGNTHAEQCCLSKIAEAHGLPEERAFEVLPVNTAIYTTMEPCAQRSPGNAPCVNRILHTKAAAEENGKGNGIAKVYVGVSEPEKFVGANKGRTMLEEKGIHYVYVPGLEDEILKVATAGHKKDS